MKFGEILYDFRANGVTVFCDQWAAMEPHLPDGPAESRAPITYASIIGTPEAIRGIRAYLPKHANSALASLAPRLPQPDGYPYSRQAPIWPLAEHNTAATHIPQLGLTHQIFIRSDPKPDQNGNFQLIATDPIDLPKMYLQVLTEHTRVIALPQWANTLWDIAKQRGWVQPATSYNIHSWICQAQEVQMPNLISELLQNSQLPIQI